MANNANKQPRRKSGPPYPTGGGKKANLKPPEIQEAKLTDLKLDNRFSPFGDPEGEDDSSMDC